MQATIARLAARDPRPGPVRPWAARRFAVACIALATLAGGGSIASAARPSPWPSLAGVAFLGIGAEPNVSVSPNGRTVLVSALGGSPTTLARSTDGGVHWKILRSTFPIAGGGDWDMRWLDNSTVVATDLHMPAGIIVHRSTDRGETFTSTLIPGELYDRPWIEHWGTSTVYVVTKGWSGVPSLFRSTDGGRSFGAPPIPVFVYGTDGLPVADSDGPGAVEGIVGGGYSFVDHVVVDPRTGTLYVLYGLADADPRRGANRLYVARLSGDRFTSHLVYRGSPEDAFLSGFNWLTVDSAGTLYALLNGVVKGHHSPRLAYSRNGGRAWSKPVDLARRGAANVFGAIAGGSPGILSFIYLHGSTEDPMQPQNWYADMGRIERASTSRPIFYGVRPLKKPVHTREICFFQLVCGAPFNDRTMLDYIWTSIGPDGRAFFAFTSDGPATQGDAVDVVVLRQTGGLRFGRGVPS